MFITTILGVHIFYPRKNSNICSDPFRPVELNQQSTNNGAPSKSSAKPRKPSRILRAVPDNINNETSPSEQKRKTMNIRKAKRGPKVIL